jgi:hypothetical protein
MSIYGNYWRPPETRAERIVSWCIIAAIILGAFACCMLATLAGSR